MTAQENASRQGWRLLREICWNQRAGLGIGVMVGLCWTVAKVAVPRLVGYGVDVIKDERAVQEAGVQAGSTGSVVNWAIVIGVAGLVAALFTGLRRYWAFRESRRSENLLR